MQVLRARVRNGRLVLDEPTDLPEGAEIELMPVDDLDDDEREELHRSLEASIAEAEAGDLVDGPAFWRSSARRHGEVQVHGLCAPRRRPGCAVVVGEPPEAPTALVDELAAALEQLCAHPRVRRRTAHGGTERSAAPTCRPRVATSTSRPSMRS
ncbi:MAG: hypothetical protein IPM79_26345 [Polyangiaceae bacterium]|nr:hypothetical protein [Polyangiaceae bacterium]